MTIGSTQPTVNLFLNLKYADNHQKEAINDSKTKLQRNVPVERG